jgi:peptidoglycan/LPS O-acetylase OafA/YrhL
MLLSATREGTDGGYRDDIDGLRGVAVSAVVLFHARVAGFDGGFVGVDIFFVISWFVITQSLLRSADTGRNTALAFYERRAKRLLPALVLVALSTLAAALFLIPAQQFDPFSDSLTAVAFFASNIYFWKHDGYWADPTRPLLHTWSLGVEEQFYLLAPLAMLALSRWVPVRRRAWAVAPFLLASLALSACVTNRFPFAKFFSLPTRAWEILLGVCLALSGSRTAPSSATVLEVLSLLGSGLLVIPIVAYSSATPFPGLWALPPCAGAAIVLYVGSQPRPPRLSRLLAMRPLVGLGRVSYSLYLLHWPILALAPYGPMRTLTSAEQFALVALAVIVSMLLYVWVERPARESSLSQPAVFGAALMAIGLVASVGWFGPSLQGYVAPDLAQQRTSQSREDVGRAMREGTCLLYGPAIDARAWDVTKCVRTVGPGGEILLWGDSFAAHYSSGLDTEAGRVHGTVIQYTAQGCPPFLAAVPNPCSEFNKNALDLISRRSISRVVLAANWSEYPARDVDEIKTTLLELRRRNVLVVVIGQTPAFFTDPAVILARRGQAKVQDASAPIDVDAAGLNVRLSGYTAAAGGTFIDPISHMCPRGLCTVRAAGQDLYLDYGHYTQEGSRRAVAAYFPFISR